MNAALWLLSALLCFALCGGVALAQEPAAASQARAAEPTQLIDLNRASIAELTSLPGIGQKRAEAILAFRASHGGFQNVAQLLKIKGIGRAMLRKLRVLVTVSSVQPAAADTQLAEAPEQPTGSGDIHRVR